MNPLRKSLVAFCLLLFAGVPALAQAWEYVNLRQLRVKDTDVFKTYVKHAFPYLNKNGKVLAVNRAAATGESGRMYVATYFASMDNVTTFLKERRNDWDEYMKSPGNLAQSQIDNSDGGADDVLWKLDKDMSNTPAGVDISKMAWRKLIFVTVKPGMMDAFIATRKQIKEADKKLGLDYPILYMTASYGAPANLVLISIPAANAVEFYTAAAARAKAREANPDVQALWKKWGTMGSNALIDQITMIPY